MNKPSFTVRESVHREDALLNPHVAFAESPAATFADRVNILLVDDEPKNLTVLETVLDNPNYRLVKAESADQALLALVVEEFALIVLDIHMPGMSGFELAHMIKQRRKTAEVPIIFLTAYYSEDQHVLEGYGTGAVDYLHKPVNPTILRSKVGVFVDLYRRTRESELANRALLVEVTERRRVQEQLVLLNGELEHRIDQRTSELLHANIALRESEERFRFLDSLSEATRAATRPEMIVSSTVQMLGQHLKAIRCAYADMSLDEETFSIRFDWNRAGDCHPGEYRLDIFGADAVEKLRQGATVDLPIPPLDSSDGSGVSSFVQSGAKGLLCSPLVKSGGLVALIIVERDQPSYWTEAEVALVKEVVERSSAHVERVWDAAALVERERELQTIADNTPDILVRYDRGLRPVFANAAIERVTGRKRSEIIGQTNLALGMPADLCQQWESAVEEVFAKCRNQSLEFQYTGPDGPRYYAARLIPELGLDDEVEFVLGVVHDITDRKRATEALQEADRRKDEFLAMLGHELRDPLAPIRNAVSVLKQSNCEDQKLNWCHDIIDRQSKQLARLVDDLLDVSRVSRGKIQLHVGTVDLLKVVQQALEASRPLIDSRRHRVILDLSPQPVPVDGDFAPLSQVVSNLLNNAAKYTDEGGQIWVKVRGAVADDARAIQVRDSGRGFDSSAIAKLFDLFYQVDRDLDRADGGLGIGLSLVRNLVEMHHGTVEAHSAGRGQGSEFIVRLPGSISLASSEADSPPADPKLGNRAAQILVVDDNRDAALCLEMMLAGLGHEVLLAYDGEEAVQVALRESPEMVLLDIGLPRLNGYQACQSMRKQGLTAALIVAVTGYGQEEDRQLSHEVGFDLHLTKPVDLLAIRALLAQHAATDY